MGFSLKLFFEHLQQILASEDFGSDEIRVEALKEYVEKEREYAETCGQLH